MILVDTSLWIDHLQRCNDRFAALLIGGCILSHVCVIGEIALGTIRQRKHILQFLNNLPQAVVADHKEIVIFIEKNNLFGKGIGYVDTHLLCSARLSHARVWTRDKRLLRVAEDLGLAYNVS